jgi:hypothetical protein
LLDEASDLLQLSSSFFVKQRGDFFLDDIQLELVFPILQLQVVFEAFFGAKTVLAHHFFEGNY